MCFSSYLDLWLANATAQLRGLDASDTQPATRDEGTCAAALVLWTSCPLKAWWPPQRCIAAQTACRSEVVLKLT